MKKRTAFLVLFIWAGLVLAAAGEQERVLTGTNYFHSVRTAIQTAKTAIDIQMYFIVTDPSNADDPVSSLLDELAQARTRGVSVHVMLENGKFRENLRAYRILRSAGIDVTFDTADALLHTKAIVIDGRICIVGSTNWSRAAIERNHEIAVLVESTELAKELAAAFAKVKRGRVPVIDTEARDGPGLSPALLKADGPLSRMVTDRADHAFDLYLMLLRKAHGTGTMQVDFDSELFRKQIGCRNVRRPRLRLEKRYGLIEYSASKQIVVIKPAGPAKDDGFVLCAGYWDFGFARTLSLRAKFMYLVALREAARSTRAPYWFRSQKDLADLYGISDYTVSLGLQELERANIIEVERSAAHVAGGKQHDAAAFAVRRANVYCVNPLLSPAVFKRKLARLSEEYGEKVVRQATDMAADLNEPNDLVDIEAFARLIVDYGYATVKKINAITASAKKGGGRRTIENTIELLSGRQ